jgi:protoheme IX farnesyltransferase
LTLAGLLFLYLINYKTAFFAALSVFLYTCIYTPLKPITPLSVFVGAIPGAIPFMLGWVAATNQFGIEPGTLFMIQFFWQFPHFWSLGWMLDDDYKKAGFIMLPTGKRDKRTALQIILYIIWMIIISIFPATGLTGLLYLSIESAIIIFILGLIMLFMGINLYNGMNIVSAKRLFIYTIFYLTLVQLIYIVDKFL